MVYKTGLCVLCVTLPPLRTDLPNREPLRSGGFAIIVGKTVMRP